MSNKLYNDLPKDLQQVLDQAGQKYFTGVYNNESDAQDAAAQDQLVKYGVKLVVWSDAEKARVRDAAASVWLDFAKELDGNGQPGSKMVAALRALQEKARTK